MKKLYALLFILGGSITANAQGYTISPSNTMDEQVTLNVYTTTTINLVHDNLSTDSVEIQWEVVGNTMQAGWDYSWCAYLDCFGQNITSGTFDKFGPGQTAFFKVNLNPMSITGSGQVQIRIFNTSTPNLFDTLTYNYNATLGIEEASFYDQVNIYPNPTSGNKITIEGALASSEVSIIDALGQVIYQTNTNEDDTLALQGLNLRNGVYFVRLITDNTVYSTRKLIVK